MKILVTGGGCREYIDGVRYIGNSSSGKTAAGLVNSAVARACEVTWLGSRYAQKPTADCVRLEFDSFAELAEILQQQLTNKHFDVVFHAAAVSDFRIAEVVVDGQSFLADKQGKISGGEELNLRLVKNPKLLDSIKNWSKNKQLCLVGFKLTNGNSEQQQQAVQRMLKRQVVDYLAHNDLSDITEQMHYFNLYQANSGLPLRCAGEQALLDHILDRMEKSEL